MRTVEEQLPTHKSRVLPLARIVTVASGWELMVSVKNSVFSPISSLMITSVKHISVSPGMNISVSVTDT